MQSKQQEILQCVMPTLVYYLLALNPKNESAAESDRLPFVAFGAEDCG